MEFHIQEEHPASHKLVELTSSSSFAKGSISQVLSLVRAYPFMQSLQTSFALVQSK